MGAITLEELDLNDSGNLYFVNKTDVYGPIKISKDGLSVFREQIGLLKFPATDAGLRHAIGASLVINGATAKGVRNITTYLPMSPGRVVRFGK